MSASVQPAASLSLSSLAAYSNATHTSGPASSPHLTPQASEDRAPSSLSLIGSANAARVRLTKDVSIQTRLVYCETPVLNTCRLLLLLYSLPLALSFAPLFVRTAPIPLVVTTAGTGTHGAQPLFR